MVTLAEILRWIVYRISRVYTRLAGRIMRRDRLVAGSERKFRALLEAAPDAFVIVDGHGHIALVNAQTERLFGYRRSELLGRHLDTLVPARLRAVHRVHLKGYLRDPTTRPMGGGLELLGQRKDGSEFPIEISLSPLETDEGLLVSGAIRDITGRRDEEAKFRGLLESAPDAMVIVDEEGVIVLVNGQAERLFGYERAQLIGGSIDLLVPERFRGGHGERRHAYMGDARPRGMGGGLDLFGRRRDGTEFPIEISLSPLETVQGTLVSSAIRDITDRKRGEAQLRHLADHDALTGLLNRRRFEEELVRELATVERYGGAGAMLLLDIDGLKDVNDTLGHARGDELIRSVGTLVAGRMRETDVVGRLGGDEFGVLLPHTSVDDARGVALELLKAVREHGIILGGQRVRLSASVGVAGFADGAGTTSEDVLVTADFALYDAKEAGRDRLAVHLPDANDVAARQARVSWSQRIRRALDEDLLVAYRQPIMDLRTRTISRYELLVRMIDETGHVTPPSVFLPAAERTGAIIELDRMMIAKAVELIAHAQRAGQPTAYSVNVSARSLGDPSLPTLIFDLIRTRGIDPSYLTFEITETAAIANIEQARALAHLVRDAGCGFALDDFGAGFASFYYLKYLPIDSLKIDGDFIRDLVRNPTDQVVVHHMAAIAETLGLYTIAEWVEDAETLETLAGYGVHAVQGFHVGPPAPVVGDGVVATDAADPSPAG
jgi:diguanylate cyclase (GGDEF)-like protein/PAS domain S-box-containing protein